MIRLARSALAGLAFCGLVAGGFATSASARSGAYLLDLIKTEPYRDAWTKMLATERDVPSWIKDFLATGDGVNTPSQMVPVGLKAFTYATLCEPHDCGDNMLYVMFAPDGSKAYGRLVQAGKTPRLFGKPDAQIQSVLSTPP
jgi:Inhibitor of vertebrate lysozyme (Ivy)